MRYVLELTGTSEMLHHSTRLVDPDDEFTSEIAKLTGKRKKTKDDRDEIARLEWYGGLYADGGTVVFPTVNFKACMYEIAKVRDMRSADPLVVAERCVASTADVVESGRRHGQRDAPGYSQVYPVRRADRQ